jgi:alginate O-acetyltransferase complex protein AlgI
MLFSTVEFLCLFLPATVAGFALATALLSLRAGTAWLVAASLFFYGYWDVWLLPLLLGSIVVNFACGRRLHDAPSRPVLVAGLVFNLGLLAYFKYAGFFVDNLESLIGAEIAELNIVLPLAISFFTFQQIAYLVDVHQGKAAEPDFLNYMLFVSFFPQLVSGPIVHHSEMMPQFRDRARRWLDRALLPAAFGFLIIGLYKKAVLADGIAPFADRVFDGANTAVPAFQDAWIGALAYTFQIYFDFSGYSDMAVGIALLFGIRLPLNFNSPYRATSIIDFWRRWHITLSRFIRDYVYIPLGGNRKGKTRRYVNLLAAMLLAGLWHGVGWTFVIWGGLHGLLLIVNHGWRRLFPERAQASLLSVWLRRAVTFLAVVVAWVFFRADDMAGAGRVIQGMAGMTGGAGGSVLETGRVWAMLAAMLAIVWLMPNTWQLFRLADPVVVPDIARSAPDGTAIPVPRAGLRTSLMLPAGLVLGLTGLLVVLNRGAETQRFIYMIF